MGSTEEAPTEARPHATAPLVWRASYAAFALALAAAAFALSRMKWAWPDAACQTTVLDIEAVDHVSICPLFLGQWVNWFTWKKGLTNGSKQEDFLT